MERKKIPGHRQYEIDIEGNIYRIIGRKTPEIPINKCFHKTKGKSYPNGYYYTTLLSKDVIVKGEIFDVPYTTPIAIHRLLALAFIPNEDPLKVWVNHKDGNKLNNKLENLEWTTISQNIQHAHDTGLKITPKGKDHWRYGKSADIETRKKMSDKKKGINHPKWKGYYFANFKRFESCAEAARYLKMHQRTIHRRCHNPKFKLKGYYFLPKDSQNTQ